MKLISLVALAALSATVMQADASGPRPMREAGMLTCNLDANVGLVLGSVRAVECTHEFRVYRNRWDRRGRLVRESYAGAMTRAGFDIGVTSAQTVSWRVRTPGGIGGYGLLNGVFGGASSDASVVLGAGTHALLAENGSVVALDPVAGSGQVGFGVGFGATDLELRRVPAATFTAYRY